MRPLAILVRGHAPGHGASSGAWGEYDSLPEYMISAEIRLRAMGCDVIRLELGGLAERQRRGLQAIDFQRNRYPGAPCIYASCHLNAGGPDYQRSVIFHDARSGLGLQAARPVSNALSERLSWPMVVRASEPSEGAPARVHACIGSIYSATPANCCAVLVELLSVDRQPISVSLLRKGGTQLGLGLAAHLQELSP